MFHLLLPFSVELQDEEGESQTDNEQATAEKGDKPLPAVGREGRESLRVASTVYLLPATKDVCSSQGPYEGPILIPTLRMRKLKFGENPIQGPPAGEQQR